MPREGQDVCVLCFSSNFFGKSVREREKKNHRKINTVLQRLRKCENVMADRSVHLGIIDASGETNRYTGSQCIEKKNNRACPDLLCRFFEIPLSASSLPATKRVLGINIANERAQESDSERW